MTESSEKDNNDKPQLSAAHTEPQATPIYQKPVLRKYDQIEQVKPYGPSELEAG
jgi:hypothetical protein